MKMITLLLLSIWTLSCNPAIDGKEEQGGKREKRERREETEESEGSEGSVAAGKWSGTFSNGMKGAKLSFEVSEDGTELSDLTFQGYWRCDGKLELTTLGPSKSYEIIDGRVDGTIKEGADNEAPFYFELHGKLSEDKGSGTLRIIFGAAGCDTYELNWAARKI